MKTLEENVADNGPLKDTKNAIEEEYKNALIEWNKWVTRVKHGEKDIDECQKEIQTLEATLRGDGNNQRNNKIRKEELKKEIVVESENQRTIVKTYEDFCLNIGNTGVQTILDNYEQSLREAVINANKTNTELRMINVNMEANAKKLKESAHMEESHKARLELKKKELEEIQVKISEHEQRDYEDDDEVTGEFNDRVLRHYKEEKQTIDRQQNERGNDQSNNNNQYSRQFNINYKPPPGFDKTEVIGRVIELFEVTDDQYQTALNKIGANNLLSVVVKSYTTAETLLSSIAFPDRVKLMPLDKIQSNNITDSKYNRAVQIATNTGCEIKRALDVIKYDKNKYRTVMENIFGQVLICSSTEMAKEICFACEVKVMTLNADQFNPFGTVSGGYNDQRFNIINNYKAYVRTTKGWDVLMNRLRDVERKIADEEKKKSEHDVIFFL